DYFCYSGNDKNGLF
nr:immunoglobulin light chain junction region [Macaca mulatta]